MAGSRQLKVEIIGDGRSASAAFQKVGGDSVSLGSIVKQSIGIGAAAAVVGFGLKAANAFKETGTEVIKLQRLAGGTAETMSGLAFAAHESGVDFDTLTKSIGILSKNIESGKAEGLGLGVAFQDANGHALPLNDILGSLADKFASMPAGADKTALAMQLFGRAGAAMIPLLNQGKAGLTGLEAEAKKYGLTLTQNDLVAVQKNIQAHREFSAALQGLQVQVGSKVLPVMTSFMNVGVHLATDAIGLVGFFQRNTVAAGALGTVLAVSVAPAALTAATSLGTFVLAVAGGAIERVAGVVDGIAASFSGVAVAEDAATASALGFDVASGGTLLILAGSVALVAGAFKLLGDNGDSALKKIAADADKAGHTFATTFEQSLPGTADDVNILSTEIDVLTKKMGEAAVQGYVQGQATDGTTKAFELNKTAAADLKDKLEQLKAEMAAEADPATQAAEAQKAAADEAKKYATALGDLSAAVGQNIATTAQLEGLPLDAVQKLTQAEQSLTSGMASGFNSATSLVSAFGDQAKVTFRDINKFFKDQEKAAASWSTNLQTLIKDGVDRGLVQQLAEAGPKSAPLVAGLLDDVKRGNLGVINQSQQDLRFLLAGTQQVVASYEAPFFATGAALGQGMIHGLQVTILGNIDAVVTAVGQVINTTKTHFGISSPSKVTHDKIGVPLGQGVVEGFKKGMAGVADVAAGINFAAPTGGGAVPVRGGIVYAPTYHVAAGATAESVKKVLDDHDRDLSRQLAALGR